MSIMDSLSQLVLGAATAEAIAGKKYGNKAILWGMIGGTIPDLDVFIRPFVNDLQAMDWHRGISHSFLFFLVISPMLGWLISRIYKGNQGSPRFWTGVMFATLVTHVLLDCFTTWGTQVFWPLQVRVAWHTVFVADPLYTVPLVLSTLVVLFIRRNRNRRPVVNWTGIALSSVYLLITVVNKGVANRAFERAFHAHGVDVEYFETRPTPLNTILWTGMAKTDDGYYTGYYSLLDTTPSERIQLAFTPGNHELLQPYEQDKDVQQLVFLSQGYYAVEATNGDSLVYHDLRFGQAAGLNEEDKKAVFSFSIRKDALGNAIIRQLPQPDFSGPEAEAMLDQLIERLKGI
ncbi:MAG: hypothetical protein RL226_247 [Bacteroidota bacterium]